MTITSTLSYFHPPGSASGAFQSRRAGPDALPPFALVAIDRAGTRARHVCANGWEGVLDVTIGFIARQFC